MNGTACHSKVTINGILFRLTSRWREFLDALSVKKFDAQRRIPRSEATKGSPCISSVLAGHELESLGLSEVHRQAWRRKSERRYSGHQQEVQRIFFSRHERRHGKTPWRANKSANMVGGCFSTSRASSEFTTSRRARSWLCISKTRSV